MMSNPKSVSKITVDPNEEIFYVIDELELDCAMTLAEAEKKLIDSGESFSIVCGIGLIEYEPKIVKYPGVKNES